MSHGRVRQTSPDSLDVLTVPGASRLIRGYRRSVHGSWNAYRHFGPLARWDPHQVINGTPSHDPERGVLYAVDSLGAYLAHVYGPPGAVAITPDEQVVAFTTQHPLRLIDLTTPHARVTLGKAVLAGEAWTEAQILSQEVYLERPDVHGIAAIEPCTGSRLFVLFDRARSAVPVTPDVELSLTDPEIHARVVLLAAELGMRVYRLAADPLTESAAPSGIILPDRTPIAEASPTGRAALVSVREVTDEILRSLSQDPFGLHQLTPRRFEEVIAELVARRGYHVELTAHSRDGGVDIVALRNDDIARVCLAIECKRYDPQRRVQVGLVRQLHGVVSQRNFSAGVLVTTASFTRGALELQRDIPARLSLRDFDAVCGWLRGTGDSP